MIESISTRIAMAIQNEDRILVVIRCSDSDSKEREKNTRSVSIIWIGLKLKVVERKSVQHRTFIARLHASTHFQWHLINQRATLSVFYGPFNAMSVGISKPSSLISFAFHFGFSGDSLIERSRWLEFSVCVCADPRNCGLLEKKKENRKLTKLTLEEMQLCICYELMRALNETINVNLNEW